jgi:AraC-like DNA-binding protein
MHMHVDLELRVMPGLKIGTGLAHGISTPRTKSLLKDGNDDLYFSIGLEGQIICEQRGERVIVEPGQMHLASNAEEMAVAHLNSRAMGLAVPRKALDRLVLNIEDRIAAPLPRQLPGLQLLQNYIAALVAAPNAFSPELCHTATTHVYDLIAIVLGASREAQEIVNGRGLKAARLLAIKAYIGKHLSDFNLSVSTVAIVHRVTLRYVQRLFENDGTTFSAYVLDQRLAFAHRLLTNPHKSDRTIGMIAADAGFSDIPHFNHMFKRRYNATPSEIRGDSVPTESNQTT